jgi:UDP-N-acetylglucosamine 2-epimerase (non-hydrolysing)
MKKINRKKILCIIGTRPEVIKMAPNIERLKKQPWAKVCVVVTAQHREMLDQMLSIFNIKPDIDLNIMTPNQSLSKLTAALIEKLSSVFEKQKPDCVLAQGDTTTVFVASLLSFYAKIPFGHVEAGLRTSNIYYPFPEEANRILAGQLSDLHFAPTQTAKRALLKENIPANKIFVTGNTVIDSLLSVSKKIKKEKNQQHQKLILVTAHRRENFGENFLNICKALKKIVTAFQDVRIVYPVHLNPNIQKIAYRELHDCSRVELCQPLNYFEFIKLMKKSYCILTDSGGIQEEAPALGKPVLVLRNETERPEAVKAKVVKLVGLDPQKIFNEVKKLLTNQKYYHQMAKGVSPYGDGKAAMRIVSVVKKRLFQ